MRILFDKNVPHQLRSYLQAHTVLTAAEQGWARLTNGDLLQAAEAHGFDVMVTADQNLEYQQDLRGRRLALVVLSTNHIGVLEQHPEKLIAAVACVAIGSYEFVKYDTPQKPKPTGR